MSAYRENHSTNHVLIRLTESWRNALDNNKLVGTVLMDLSKAFDCIPHDLLVAKLYMYGFSENSITFFYSYLKRRVQCVKINEICSTSKTLLSGIPQGSIMGPILFNIFLNDMITVINKTDIYNFADDNTLSVIAENRDKILNVLCQESELAVNWFKENSMIVNPDKFQSMILDKQDKNNISSELNISGNKIKTKESVKLLGISIDNQLKFDTHVSNLCKQASMQLNAISRLKQYMGRKEIEVLLNSFIYSNFNYCPLVWNFCSCKSSSKIEQIQKHCLKLLLDDNVSDYKDLLHKSHRSTMVVKRLRVLAIEIFKTLNSLNPSYMKDIFSPKNVSKIHPNNIAVKSHQTAKYGDKSLTCLGPKIWNSLPEYIKAENCYKKFKEFIDTWMGPICNCYICHY